MKKLNLIATLFKGAFSSLTSTVAPNSLIAEIKDITDKLFTSDEERKKLSLKLDELAAASGSTFAKTARSGVIWSMSLIAVYQFVIRDLLANFMGVELPSTGGVDWEEFLNQVLLLAAGTL